jgi:quinol monooxygenase YgiN
VFAPVPGKAADTGVQSNELLFIDVWEDPAGLGQFFSNPHVGEQASKLFSARDAAVWMPARGGFGFNLPAPSGKGERYVGLLRASVASAEKAVEAFRKLQGGSLRAARARGQMSHELYFRVDAPQNALELLGVDLWYDAEGMKQHYAEAMAGYAEVFSSKPQTSVWMQPAGSWSEW